MVVSFSFNSMFKGVISEMDNLSSSFLNVFGYALGIFT